MRRSDGDTALSRGMITLLTADKFAHTASSLEPESMAQGPRILDSIATVAPEDGPKRVRAERLRDFAQLVGRIGTIGSYAAKLAVLLPLTDIFLKFGPPYPGGLPFLTSMAMLVVLMWTFHQSAKYEREQLARRFRVALATMCLCAFAYLFFDANWVYAVRDGGRETRLVAGFVPSQNTWREAMAASRSPLVDRAVLDELLQSKVRRGDAPEEIWTPSSVAARKLALVLVWLGMFLSLISYIAYFVLMEQMEVVPAPVPTRSAGVLGQPQSRRSYLPLAVVLVGCATPMAMFYINGWLSDDRLADTANWISERIDETINHTLAGLLPFVVLAAILRARSRRNADSSRWHVAVAGVLGIFTVTAPTTWRNVSENEGIQTFVIFLVSLLGIASMGLGVAVGDLVWRLQERLLSRFRN